MSDAPQQPDSPESARHGYDFAAIERKWQQYWQQNQVFAAQIEPDKPSY